MVGIQIDKYNIRILCQVYKNLTNLLDENKVLAEYKGFFLRYFKILFYPKKSYFGF